MRGLGMREDRGLMPLFLVAVAVAATWVGVLWFHAAEQAPVSQGAFVTDYDGRVLDDGLEILLVQGDGQAFATLARDPLLRRPQSFAGAESAYRAQRPVLPYLAWALSLGQPGWVPPALALTSILATGMAVAGAGALVAERGRSAYLALPILLLPGLAASLEHFGPEPLVLAALLWGLVAWERERLSLAAALFAVAILGRETAMLVPLVLAFQSVAARRWDRARALACGPVLLACWWTVLRLRVGAWPPDAGRGRLGLPFRGLHEAVRTAWVEQGEPNAAYILATAVVVFVAVGIAPRSNLTAIVVVHAVFAMFLGVRVWADVEFYGRVLLPMYALAVVVVAREFGRTQHTATVDPAWTPRPPALRWQL